MKKEKIIDALATVTFLFISCIFIWWGWNTLAPHINCPEFTYMEIFAMRMGFGYIVAMFRKKKEDK
jgi:TRAP-type C4-dicarboxylate transport system permease small subunit